MAATPSSGDEIEDNRPPVDVDLLSRLRDVGDDLTIRGWLLYYLASGWTARELSRVLGWSHNVIQTSTVPYQSVRGWRTYMESPAVRGAAANAVRREFERQFSPDQP